MSSSKCYGCGNPEYLCVCSEIDCFDDGRGDIESLARSIKVESDALADALAVLEEVRS